MNKFLTQEQVSKIKKQYPIGTKIKLLSMDDPYAPIESGTIGEIVAIDDIGTFTMKWSNGRSLGLVPFEDKFEVISKPEQLQKGKLLTKSNVVVDSKNQDYTDEIVVLSSEKLNEESRTPENQLWIATHGPGIDKVNSFTSTVHLKHPIDGDVCDRCQWQIKGAIRSGSGQNLVSNSEQQILGTTTGDTMAVHRNDILGIAKQEVVEMYLTEQSQTIAMGGISQ